MADVMVTSHDVMLGVGYRTMVGTWERHFTLRAAVERAGRVYFNCYNLSLLELK